MQMSVTEEPGPVTRIALAGRLDAAGADAVGLRFTASAAGAGHHVLVDLSGVEFIASMGIRLLIATARGLHSKSGHKLVLFGASAMVQEVFDDAALGQIIPIVATQDEALAELAG